jgi:hypothetical protein
MHVNMYEEIWDGPWDNWVFRQSTINQTYDGNGRPAKRIETRHSEDINNNVTHEVKTVYQLRSTVLGGATISDIYDSGERETHVYAGGAKLAEFSTSAPLTFRHANPANGNWINVTTSGFGSRTEFDPLGASVGTFSPYTPYSVYSYSDVVGSEWLYAELGNPLDLGSGCTMDGMPISCTELNNRMETGLVAVEYLFRGQPRRDAPPTLRPAERSPTEIPTEIDWQRETHIIRSFGLGVFSVDCPRWASDNEGSGRLNPGTAVFRSHHAQQNPGHAREIERLNALVDSRYAECVRRLGNSPAPSQAATKAILTTSLLEGTDPTLLAVTWQKEAIPPFNFSPVSNYRPEDGGWDVGPLQTSTTYYDKSPFTDGLPNPFGTSRSETQAFNGNPYSSLRVGARALNEISSRSRGRADTAGIYRAGSRSPASYTTRFNEFNALSPGYDAFFNCLRN